MKDLHLGASASEVDRNLGPPYPFPDALKKLGPNEVNRPLDWETLTPEQKDFQAFKMAVHAAMVECMDQQIGRLIARLRETEQLDNTVILFLSDNGASAEIMVRGDGHAIDAFPGSKESFLCLGPGWSTVCNTPFRKHKTWVHEGGICTPCILHWPKAVAPRSQPIDSPMHVIDVAPTVLEIASIDRVTQEATEPRDEKPPMPGQSFLGMLNPIATPWSEQKRSEPESQNRVLWWQHEQNRAVRQGDWKLVASGKESPWELYHLGEDRTESRNVASDHPEQVQRLAELWETMRAQHQALALKPDK